MKQTKTLCNARLCYRPEVGSPAFIVLENNDLIRTSAVVSIYRCHNKGWRVETKNTIYFVFDGETPPSKGFTGN